MKPRILFVDDHEDTQQCLSILLDRLGYELRTANSLTTALKLAKSENFDLFLLDYFLSADGTGKELCERIREFNRETPILFFSGSTPKMQQEALSCGAQGFVLKPDLDALRTEIKKTLRAA